MEEGGGWEGRGEQRGMESLKQSSQKQKLFNLKKNIARLLFMDFGL